MVDYVGCKSAQVASLLAPMTDLNCSEGVFNPALFRILFKLFSVVDYAKRKYLSGSMTYFNSVWTLEVSPATDCSDCQAGSRDFRTRGQYSSGFPFFLIKFTLFPTISLHSILVFLPGSVGSNFPVVVRE